MLTDTHSHAQAGAALQALDGARARFGAPPSMLPGAALSSLGASRLVSAGRGSTSGSGRCPSAFRGPPPRCCQAQHFRALQPRGSFLLAGAALQALDGARARFGAPPLDAARRSTFEPCSLAARFCWQGQHFRLWTVPERVSGPPPRCCQAQHL